MGRLESPTIRWGISFLFLAVELLLFLVIGDLYWADQLVILGITLFLFALLPSIVQSAAEKGSAPVEARQQRRAALVTGVVDRVAVLIRIDTVAPVLSWIAAAFLVILAGGTLTDRPGFSLRMVFSAGVYVSLAAFATPAVRRSLQEKLQLRFSRLVVVIILVSGVLVNEELVTPSVEQSAAILLL